MMTEEKNKNNINYQPKMLVGTDDFYDLLINSDIFVDKSLMIKELLEDSGKVTLITRPRRWGKSLNMDMVRRFFEAEVDEQGQPLPQEQKVNYKLFVGGEVDLGLTSGKKRLLQPLQIAKYSEIMLDYQGQFPVILITFKGVRGNSYKEIESNIRYQVTKLFSNYRYLETYLTDKENLLNDAEKKQLTRYFNGEFGKVELENSLKFLSDLLFKHFNQKTYILIDEYDTPINSAYMKFGSKAEEFEEVLSLFRAIFGNSLKGNDSLQKGVITGILRIAKANLFSDLNNLTECSLLDENFTDIYGFTQAEVDELLTKVPTTTNPEQIKNWYNGYNFGGEIIYNPWSIMRCLASKGKLDHYWIDSGRTQLVDKALLSDEMQEDLRNLVTNKTITLPIMKQISFSDINKPVGLFSLLLFSGYLNPTAKNPEKNIYELSVPNKEIKYIYEARMLRWLADQLETDDSRYYSLINLLPSGKIEEFASRLQELLQNATSFHQVGEKKAELFYSGFMLGLINTLTTDYVIDSERESGYGRPDIVMIPKLGKGDKAMVIEYKSKTYANGKVDQWVYLAAWDPKNPNKKIYVREDEVLAKIEEVFKKIGIRDPELLKDTLEHLKNTNELKKDEHDKATASFKKEHTENEKRLNSLIDLRLNGELSTEEFQAKKQQLKDRQYEISRLLKIYDEADDKFTDTASTLITLASEAYETFKGSEMPQKRKMIKFVFQNLKLRGKKLETSLRFPFDIFEKTTTRTEWRGVVNNFRTQSDTKLLVIQTLTLYY